MVAIDFTITHPSGQIRFGKVLEVQLPTPAGPITLLAGHMPLISSVGSGVVTVRRNSEVTDHYAVSGGMLSVTPAGADLTTDAADHGDSVDELLVRQSIEEGKKTLETELSEQELAMISASVQHNMMRLEAAERQRRHRGSTMPRM